MVTGPELLRIVLVPAIVAGLIAVLGWWIGRAWVMPIAAGVGFLAGYAALTGHLANSGVFAVPRLPPRDGSDWLFWLAIPLTALGVIHAMLAGRWWWGWLFGAAAGVTSVIIWPLVPGTVSAGAAFGMAALLAAVGAILVLGIGLAEPRVGAAAVIAGLCLSVAGAAVVVLSSNFRVVGLYGIAAAAALGPVAFAVARNPPQLIPAGRSVLIVFVPIVAGLLVAGRYYPDPGVTWTNFVVLMVSPGLVCVGAAVPGKRRWVRGVVAGVAVALAVAAVSIPTAFRAKRAAEADPYAAYSY